jgi:hyaluronate lyase
VNPSNSTYSYIQLPAATQAQTSSMASSNDIAVVANNNDVQAATRSSTGTTMINFWSPTPPKTAGIQSNNRASIVATRKNGQLSIAVTDPTQKVTGSVTVTIDGPATSTLQTDPGITVVALSPNVQISFNASGLAGKSLVARFAV